MRKGVSNRCIQNLMYCPPMQGKCLSGNMKYKQMQASATRISQKFTSYPSYKTSGIEWLREIPAHWEVSRLKNMASLRVSKLGIKPGDSVYVGLEHIESWTGRLLLQDQPVNVESVVGQFKAGDVLFGKLRPYLAKVARPNFDGVSTSEILVFHPRPNCCQSYMMYCLLNEAYIDWIDTLTYGAKMPRVSPEQVCTSFMPLPPLADQRAIVAFLDQENAKLDVLMEKQERLIGLIQEKRTALISQVVAQGLNPSIHMKSSRVEWLGEIPAHWDVKRLKYLCSTSALYGANVSSTEYQEKGIRFIRTTDITDDGQLKQGGVFLHEKLVCNYMLNDGDILISRSGTIGRSFLYQTKQHGRCSYAGYLVRYVPSVDILPNYIFYFTKSLSFEEFIRLSSISSTIENVNANKYANAYLPLPPLSEQQSIVAFLDRETAKLDSLISKIRDTIEYLQELRIALISATVTGKIDIQGAGVN